MWINNMNNSLYGKKDKNMLNKIFENKLSQMGLIVFIIILNSSIAWSGALDMFNGEKGDIKISGGTAHIPVMQEAAKQIMSHNQDIRISIAGGGSGVGIKQVGEGLVDIGNSGRKPKDEEISKYGLKMFKWAIDGVGVAVNPKNQVKSLTTQQLIDIFSGKTDNWKLLGGIDKPINVYTRDNSSGTREVFWKQGLNKGEITNKANFVVSNGAMKSAIANDPYGIGYLSVGHIDETVLPVRLDGIIPSVENVKNGSYKISRGLYSNTKGEPQGLVKKFIDYLFSPQGQQITVKHGFISVNQ